jgi:broad specificity phosphatase PhoE
MRLVLIRHGESEHTFRGIIADVSGCTGLTEQGTNQVQSLADRLRATGELNDCRALLSSPVPRARQTAAILASALPIAPIEEDDNLCEVRPADADGLSWEAYRARYGTFDLPTCPSRPFAPGGESWSAFLHRVRATHQRLAERFAGQTVVAVTHAGFIVASLLVMFDIPRPGTGARLEPDHTSLTEWHVTGTGWTLVRFNDTGHLLKKV